MCKHDCLLQFMIYSHRNMNTYTCITSTRSLVFRSQPPTQEDVECDPFRPSVFITLSTIHIENLEEPERY